MDYISDYIEISSRKYVSLSRLVALATIKNYKLVKLVKYAHLTYNI